MIQDISPHEFDNQFHFQEPSPQDFVLNFQGRTLMVLEGDHTVALPHVSDFPEMPLHYLFAMDNVAYYLAETPQPALEGYDYVPFGKYREYAPKETAFLCATGETLYRWYRRNKFCGQCGASMEKSTTERAMVCPHCGFLDYPKICPAVIVAVCHGEKILLTKYAGREFTRYALIAGFSEIGESIEETVRREVLEEVGVHVKNLTFYKSQPWVFTDTLLMGFYCQLDGDSHITLEEAELSEGVWMKREDVPADEFGVALTAEMMEMFRQGQDPFSK
ncbi:MAG: NAD(+) diphosphatase [Eubacteriales bacterium]